MPDESSVVSSFRFESFKVDHFSFDLEKKFSLLKQRSGLSENWTMDISIRNPVYFESEKVYLAGVKAILSFRPDLDDKDFVAAKLEAVISGIFTSDGKFSEAEEEALVKCQMPAILMPYLRSVITSYLANAGFGSVLLPLVNVNKLAKMALEGKTPTVISADNTLSSRTTQE
jgi:preprotein translocase subunit SecB